ncbi:MAG TPA: ATP-binding protein [Anaerolineales bacterium]|nr:ATP-binding protein [Anaerolineales bacterium]
MTLTEKIVGGPPDLDEILRLITYAQNQGPDTANPDHLYLKIIKDSFHAEGIAMIIVDPEQSGIFTKKESTTGVDWKITSNLPSVPSLMVQTLKHIGTRSWQGDSSGSTYNEKIDGIKGLKPQNITCAPIRSHSVIFGAVSLVNCDPFPLDDANQTRLVLVLTALADHLYHEEVLREEGISSKDAKYSKAQLLQSRNVLRAIFDSIPQSFYFVDKNYVITGINHARANRAGQTPRDLYGRVCHEVLFGLKSPCPECNVATTFRTGKSTRRNAVENNEKSGKMDWEVTTYPVFDPQNEVDRIVLMEQDVTENRKLEVEVLQSEKLIAVGQLATGIAHEINNPLTAILVNSQILLEDLPEEPKENVESVRLIEMAAVRASQVIKNLLGLVRKDDYDFEEMDINESIESALMLVSHEFLTRQIKVTFDRDDKLPMFMGSSNHLQGVWINLLINAIEAIGDQKGEIKITSHFESGTYYVEVRDSGVGISEANLGKIFAPYFTTKRSGAGTGLGLSLVKRTIQAHGGQIMVDSSPGEGARFTVILPEKK